MQISDHPESSPKSNIINGLHQIVITKQTSLLYKFDENSIKIITLFDTRMNPKNIKVK